jgi:hypothetical protein
MLPWVRGMSEGVEALDSDMTLLGVLTSCSSLCPVLDYRKISNHYKNRWTRSVMIRDFSRGTIVPCRDLAKTERIAFIVL